MLRHKFLSALIGTYALLGASALTAEEQDRNCPHCARAGMMHMGMSEPQSEQLRDLSREHRMRMYSLRLDRQIAQMQYKKLLMQPNPSERELRQALDMEHAAQKAIAMERHEFMGRLREMMSHEQFQSFVVHHMPGEGKAWDKKRARWRGRGHQRMRGRKDCCGEGSCPSDKEDRGQKRPGKGRY